MRGGFRIRDTNPRGASPGDVFFAGGLHRRESHMMGASAGKGGASALRFWVRVGVLSAVAFLLMLLEFNFPFFPAFLQYDPSEVPALIGGFAMGPAAGFAVVAGKCI